MDTGYRQIHLAATPCRAGGWRAEAPRPMARQMPVDHFQRGFRAGGATQTGSLQGPVLTNMRFRGAPATWFAKSPAPPR